MPTAAPGATGTLACWLANQDPMKRRSRADDEIVQCEVLHYGDVSEFTAWVSTAKRRGKFGAITGATHGEEYRGDVAESAHTMNLQLNAAVAPPHHRQSRLRALLKRFV